MSTSTKSTSKKSTSTKTHAAPAETSATPAIAGAIPATIAAAGAPPVDPTATARVPNIVLIALPPTDANIPAPPTGFVAPSGTSYRGITPKRAELAVLPKALEELGRFADYAAVFGKGAPPLATLQETLNAALQWSLMRNSTDAWDLFSRTMEGIAWLQARGLMDKLDPMFTAAAAADATIESQNPSLSSLLNAARVIAQKGAATRKANAKLEAKGETPVHGKEAARVRRAAKIVAQAGGEAAGGAQGATGGAAAVASPAPQGAPVVAAAPVAGANGAGGTTNGAGH